MEEQLPQLAVTLRVVPDSHHLFTTLLQSGVEVKSTRDRDMGTFLCQLPGFSHDYIANNVETIFLDGMPLDDLSQHFEGDSPTLALSAAMPGLAGAIFRKNSIHSALRTTTVSTAQTTRASEQITVTLKLFNTIAKGAGSDLLQAGVSIKSSKVVDFLTRRIGLCDYITHIECGGETTTYERFLETSSRYSQLHLKVIYAHG